MSAIEFKNVTRISLTDILDVMLDGKKVGTIRLVKQPSSGRRFYQYRPKGSKQAGKMYQTLEGCKRSVVGE